MASILRFLMQHTRVYEFRIVTSFPLSVCFGALASRCEVRFARFVFISAIDY